MKSTVLTHNSFLNFIQSIDARLFFLLIILVQFLVIYINTQFILDASLYYEFYSAKYSFDQISRMLEIQGNLAWANYTFWLIYYPIKFMLTSLVLLTGFYVYNVRIRFSTVFKIVLIAESIFSCVPWSNYCCFKYLNCCVLTKID